MAVVVCCLLPVVEKRIPLQRGAETRDYVLQGRLLRSAVFRCQRAGLPRVFGEFVVLCSIQKWTSDAEQVQFLPLFLKGDTFLVLSRLADGDKKKANDVVGALLPTAPCCLAD